MKQKIEKLSVRQLAIMRKITKFLSILIGVLVFCGGCVLTLAYIKDTIVRIGMLIFIAFVIACYIEEVGKVLQYLDEIQKEND